MRLSPIQAEQVVAVALFEPRVRSTSLDIEATGRVLAAAEHYLRIDIELSAAQSWTGAKKAEVGFCAAVILKRQDIASAGVVADFSRLVDGCRSRGLPIHSIKHEQDDVFATLFNCFLLQPIDVGLVKVGCRGIYRVAGDVSIQFL